MGCSKERCGGRGPGGPPGRGWGGIFCFSRKGVRLVWCVCGRANESGKMGLKWRWVRTIQSGKNCSGSWIGVCLVTIPLFLWYPFRYTLLAFLFSLTFALGVLSTRREERREGGWGGGGIGFVTIVLLLRPSEYVFAGIGSHPSTQGSGGVGRGKRGAQELTKMARWA